MNVADQFQQICFLLADNRFVSILKKMPVSLMTFIEVDRITGQDFTHTGCQRPVFGFHKQVKVLCEVLDYVKLNLSNSGPLFIFLTFLVIYYT